MLPTALPAAVRILSAAADADAVAPADDAPPAVVAPPAAPIPAAASAAAAACASISASTVHQGLTLVHFSAQPEPLLTQNTPSTPPASP